ncbi:hypothetical protein [Photobacterium sp. TLY01]|uniref:hypothetical protein n=1 Tax=Photobacterium sp. TLY01 TaxID=2907534 RepID=UPI001F4430D6|nr:hypothetical protein [Photobacterium sp. TLY01]UIP28911.1 hypothetical protein LN341_05365 [Photobacterium sp. TLY01]
MTISRNPSFTPSPTLRKNLERSKQGVTARLNQIWDRYEHLLRSDAIELTPQEIEVLHNVCQGSFIEPSWIECLQLEIMDSDRYAENDAAATSLYQKLSTANYAQKLALVERLGY